jgi:hypothetical protein
VLGDVRDFLLLGAANLMALSAFGPVFGGWRYLLVGGVGVVLGSLTAIMAVRLRWPAWVAGIGTLAWFFLLGPAAATGFASLAGAIPTPVALRDLVVDATRGWHDLLTTIEPVGSYGGLLTIPWLLGLLAGLTTLTIARRGGRSAAWAAIVPVVVLGLGVLEGVEEPAWFLQGVAILVLLVVWGSVRQRAERVGDAAGARGVRWLGAIGMLVVAALLGSLAAAVLGGDRTVLRREVEPPRDDLVATSPLEEFRSYRKVRSEEVMVKVTPSDGVERLRLATLDSFDGQSWRISPESRFQRGGDTADQDTTGPLRTTEIEIVGLDTRLIPIPDGSVASLEMSGTDDDRSSELDDGLRFSPVTGSFADTAPLQQGDMITVSWSPPTASVTTGLPARPPTDGLVATVGAPVPDAIARLAGRPLDQATPLEQLLSYQKLLTETEDLERYRGYFSDGTPVGETPEPDDPLGGHSLARIDELLRVDEKKYRIGNEEQFASAIAVAATQLGFPARVVMGFEVPDGQPSITGEDITAWVEVEVRDEGWIPVSDTRPPDGDPPPIETTQNPPPEPLISAPPAPTTVPPSPRSPKSDQKPNTTSCNELYLLVVCVPSWVGTAAKVVVPPVAIVGGFTLLMSTLKRRRRFKRRTRGTADQQVAGGWMEVCDLAKDMGDVVPVRSTRRETAVVIGRPGVGELARSSDQLVFGPGTPDAERVRAYWERVEVTRGSMLAEVSWWERWKVTVNPSSLWNRSSLRSRSDAAVTTIASVRDQIPRPPPLGPVLR